MQYSFQEAQEIVKDFHLDIPESAVPCPSFRVSDPMLVDVATPALSEVRKLAVVRSGFAVNQMAFSISYFL